MDKNFKYGIASVKFGDKTIGYIEKGYGIGAVQNQRVPMWKQSKCQMHQC